jgi:peptidoglycan/LPS O-acetylase OafA/YrhL
MGFFRIILALSVFLDHSWDVFGSASQVGGWAVAPVSRQNLHVFIWSGNAVFAFFVLSGFFMAMVICEKYAKMEGGLGRFYFNRALRLYPTNWVMLACYLTFFLVNDVPSFLTWHVQPHNGWLTPVAIFCNSFFLGSELITSWNANNWQYVLGPIWSLSVEMYFYILAPFIVTKSIRFIVLLAAASLALRLTLYHLGFALTPWRYFFFPSDLVYFLLGVLAYRLHALIKPQIPLLGLASATILLGYITYQPFWVGNDMDQWELWRFYILLAVCTPFLFHFTKNNRLDNFIGHLSYPVYLGHMLSFSVVIRYYHGPLNKGTVALALTLSFAVAVYFLVDQPIEKIRRRISNAHSLKKAGNDYQIKTLEAKPAATLSP